MFDFYWTELIFVVLWLLFAFGVYWVVRLAVRHGVMDAQRRLPTEHRPER